MKSVQCTFCQHIVKLKEIPVIPFIKCERCGMRISLDHVREDTEPLVQCAKCGGYFEASVFDVHHMACSGLKHKSHSENAQGSVYR